MLELQTRSESVPLATQRVFHRKNLLDVESLSEAEIHCILDRAHYFDQAGVASPGSDALSKKTVIGLFMEASTRTRASFEIAAKRLGANFINISVPESSMSKGETLLDTVMNLNAMRPDIIILRHGSSGAPYLVANHVQASVINAGDGMHEHPTQALLDCATIQKFKGRIQGLTVSIVGDVAHSRVARSNLFALTRLGAKVRVVGPMSLIPVGIEKLGVEVYYNLYEGLVDADVVLVLRLQKERQNDGMIPSVRDYSKYFGVNQRALGRAKADAIVMHPGPMNRGVEISSDVADGDQSVVLDQVTMGVALRMAVLESVASSL